MYCTFLMLFECAATVNVTVIIFEQMLLLLSLTMTIALSCCWLLRSYECIHVCVCVRACVCAPLYLRWNTIDSRHSQSTTPHIQWFFGGGPETQFTNFMFVYSDLGFGGARSLACRSVCTTTTRLVTFFLKFLFTPKKTHKNY